MAPRTEYLLNLISGRHRGFRAGLLRLGLRLASVPYGWATCVRNRLFDRGWKRQEKVNVPVVSVGNLTVGGTGKTPCVEYAARFFRQMELNVAILSRGYGAEHGPNDEALVLEENLPDVPHLQGTDRVSLAHTAVEELESEVLVLDDGFQHRRLARDLDIVLIDATNPWGHGYLLPRGLLRESPRGLRRAGVVMLTRCDQVRVEEVKRIRERVAQLAPQAVIVETVHRPAGLVNGERETGLEQLKGKTVLGFCGLGNPEAFRRTLVGMGANVCDFRTYPDHHAYSREDVDDLRRWAGGQPDDATVLTTQKDLVKLRIPDLAGRPLWALRIHLESNTEQGMNALDEQLRRVVNAPG